MNQDYFAENWPWLRYRAQAQWPQLTTLDLDRIQGRIERLYSVLVERVGLSRRQAAHELWEFLHIGDETCARS